MNFHSGLGKMYIISIVFFGALLVLFSTVILRFLGANPASPIVALIYGISAILKIPFLNIFPTYQFDENAAIDLVGLTAFFGYILIYVFIAILYGFLAQAKKSMHPSKGHTVRKVQ